MKTFTTAFANPQNEKDITPTISPFQPDAKLSSSKDMEPVQ